MEQWKLQGKAIVFVSHRMEEIFRIADRFSVLRNGKTVGAGMMKEINEKELVGLMVETATAIQSWPTPSPVHEEICGLAIATPGG